jgi:FtsP/CotA-like multicopper oxidase with cupredoxin domain
MQPPHLIRALGAAVLGLLLPALAACGSGGPQRPAGNTARHVTVHMAQMRYQPTILHVSSGTTVTWVNDDPYGHTVTSGAGRQADKKFDSGDIGPGGQFSYTFQQPGTYAYFCAYHPEMNGTVVVDAAGARTVATPSAASESPQVPSYKVRPLGTGTQGEPKQPDGLYLLPYRVENGYKVFHLTAQPVQWQVKPGQTVEAWAFNGSVPGPEIRVDQGDRVKIEVTNELPEATSVHWHGLDVPSDQDGVAGFNQDNIQPGQTYTYTFTVTVPPGAYMYHSHPMKDMMKQEAMGLWGPFIVEPAGTAWQQVHPGYQEEYTLMLNDSAQFGYTLNGLSFPATPVLPAKVGDKILIHLINIGDMNHPMHLHGFHFAQIGQDGFPLPAPLQLDTIDTAPGGTYDLAFTADKPGQWLFHCHILPHVTSGQDMSGMITVFDVQA